MLDVRYLPEEPIYGDGVLVVEDSDAFRHVSVAVDEETIGILDGALCVMSGYEPSVAASPHAIGDVSYVRFAMRGSSASICGHGGGRVTFSYRLHADSGAAIESVSSCSLASRVSSTGEVSDEIRIMPDSSVVIHRRTAAVSFGDGEYFDVRTKPDNLDEYRLHVGDDSVTYDDLAAYAVSLASELSGDSTMQTEAAAMAWFADHPHVEAWELDEPYDVPSGRFAGALSGKVTFVSASVGGLVEAEFDPAPIILVPKPGFPVATTSKPGVVRPDGTTIRVDADGTLHGTASVDPASVTVALSVSYVGPSEYDELSLLVGSEDGTYRFPLTTSVASRQFASTAGIVVADLPVCVEVGSSAFLECADLTSASLPACTSVGPQAFARCTSLSAIDLPACTSVGASAFSGCTSLGHASLPSCTVIGSSAFRECASLSSVEAPLARAVSAYAFMNCGAMASVSLPSCTQVGEYAFAQCSSLASVILPACSYVASYAFRRCVALSEIALPSCRRIDGSAFASCTSLETIDLTGVSSVPNIVYATFNGIGAGYSIRVPASLYSSFVSAYAWSNIKSRIVSA